MPRFTFHRDERLKSQKQIQHLFKEGHSFAAYPLRIIWNWSSQPNEIQQFPIQFALSVPKKRIKKAHDRNPIRRKIREAWRLHKHLVYPKISPAEPIICMILFTGKVESPYAEIEKAMQKLIKRLPREIKRKQAKQSINLELPSDRSQAD